MSFIAHSFIFNQATTWFVSTHKYKKNHLKACENPWWWGFV